MWFSAIMALLSLTAFLAGLQVMRHGLEKMAASRLTHILQTTVKTPTRGVFTGLLATALVQSSAAVTAITVGMVSAGSMAFQDALGVVLGSNVGSTVIPQILTINLWGLVIPAFVLGVVGLLSRRPGLRNPSSILLGFASIFIALHSLSLSLSPLAHTAWFINVLHAAGQNPLLGILAGTLTSAAIQSSTATTVVTMALTADKLIPLHGGIAIVLGANIGTCLTSVIAAIGQSRQAQQVALAHVLLNVGGAALFLPFIAVFTDLNRAITANPAQQIANAHTIYNVICTLLVWPATASFGRFVQRLLPDKANA